MWDEVKDVLHRPGTALSGGQQQRLCIARAMAVEPEVLLMDEPTSAIDPIATAKIEELINELKAEYTIVIVTHNMQQAARVSDFTAFFFVGDRSSSSATPSKSLPIPPRNRPKSTSPAGSAEPGPGLPPRQRFPARSPTPPVPSSPEMGPDIFGVRS